jgi:predicted transcriptional regulator
MARQPVGRSRRQAGALEGEILAILWSASQPLTASEVQLACDGDLAYNTVHTILTRLQAKGRVRRVGPLGRSAYEPVKGAAEAAADQMRAVLDSGVDRSEVLARFVTTLNPADEAALRAALDAEA